MTTVPVATGRLDHDSPDSHLSEVPPVSWSGKDVRLLRKRLKKQRRALTRRWSDETIYPGFRATKTPEQPASHGQCGVTSAWLLQNLGERWKSAAQYCVGDVIFGEADVEKYHCWVEIVDESSRRLVIDLTCDQFQALKRVRVLIEDHASLMDRSIEYQASTRRRFDQLREDSVWGRLQVLDQAASQTPPKPFGSFRRKAMAFVHHRGRRQQGDGGGSVGAPSVEARAA